MNHTEGPYSISDQIINADVDEPKMQLYNLITNGPERFYEGLKIFGFEPTEPQDLLEEKTSKSLPERAR